MPRDERTVTILDRRLLHRSAVGGRRRQEQATPEAGGDPPSGSGHILIESIGDLADVLPTVTSGQNKR